MRVCFFGSEDFSIPSLNAIMNSGHEVVAVVTKADTKQGRGLTENATVVAKIADSLNIPVLKPEKLSDGGFRQTLFSFSPDISIVCAYGKILNQTVLECPVKGCINVHPSMLPKYRGATPIESALRAGDRETGVTIFYMDEGCDTGDIILQCSFPIEPDDVRATLREKLSYFSAKVLVDALDLIEKGTVQRIVQPKEGVCCTRLIQKEDSYIDWTLSSSEIINFSRAFWPKPGARTYFENKLLLLSPMKEVMEKYELEPGTVAAFQNHSPVVVTGNGAVVLVEVKPEGKRLMTAAEFARGSRIKIGDKLSAEN